jgi:hypothetical protein
MEWTGPGFVDHHAHLLRAAALLAESWGSAEAIRALHHSCAQHGVSPVDAIEPPERGDLPGVLRSALQRARSVGLVEIWEAGVRHPSYWAALHALRDEGPLPLRVRLLVAAGLAEREMPARSGDPWLDITGVKFYADGWLGPRTCAVSAAFRDDPDNAGLLFEPADRLARRIEPFAAAGWLIATHAIGDRAIESVLDAYDKVFGAGCRAAAPRIEHAQLLRPDLVARMAAMGVVACIQPGFALDDRSHAEAALEDEWPMAYRWSALLDAGVPVITGSDYPIDGLEPLRGLAKLLRNPFDSLTQSVALGLMTRREAGTVTLSGDPEHGDARAIVSMRVIATAPAG